MEATGEALQLEDSRPFRGAVRAGFLARGLTYALIGGLAVALALGAGASGHAPNQQGALALVAQAPLGKVVLVAAAAGLGAYALWKLALAVFGSGPEGAGGRSGFDRISNLAGGLVYIGFCALAIRVLTGTAGNQASEQRHATAGVLGWPGGREIVGGAGLVLIAICLQQIWVALTAGFAKENKTAEMGEAEWRTFLLLGRVGLLARSLVFALSGYFLVRTAIDFHVSRGVSLDGTLAEVHAQPLGNVLLSLAGAGLLVFAAFSVLEARRRRL